MMTTAISSNLPVFVVIAPFIVAFILPTISRRLRLVESLTLVLSILLVVGAGLLTHYVKAQDTATFYSMGGWTAPWGIELKIDSLSAFFVLVVAGVSLPVSMFSVANLSGEVGNSYRTTRFYVLYLILIGALAGIAFTNDMFNVFVLIEVATLSSCGLVSARNEPVAAHASFTYLILSTLGSTLVLGGIGLIYILTGHLNMRHVSAELAQVWQSSPHVVWMAISFFLVGFGVKTAIFPLHIWLPDAHSTAPSPASAILSGLAVKGFLLCLLKVLYNVFGHSIIFEFGIDRLLVLAGSIAIVAGSIFAIAQDELKRRLAYSTVAQMGYLFLGLGLMNTQGLKGALFYLASHAIIKSALFLTSGVIISTTGKKNVRDLAGVGRKMPLTMAVFTISSLGLIGIPLFSGFIGKWHLLLGGLETGNFISVLTIIAGSVLCAAYLLPVIRFAYFGSAPEESKGWKDPGLPQKTSLVLLAALILFLGVFPDPILELAGSAAVNLLSSG